MNKKAALMIQGTTSNAGKSILTAAFCRIFLRNGFSVAPFKSQNMSLNSYVTHNDCEMGRAQAVQAQACKKDPDVRMNPVLLKPNSTTGSQIVVMGKPIGSMNIHEYTKYKKDLFPIVCRAYDELASENDIIILEGAGSPAEINLKADDIVNMSMAKHAGAHVLICGDIDRGGVYAHFIGTMMCLDESEQDLVKGFLVNRFRGDSSLLSSAHNFVLEQTGKPVLGVIPYLQNICIPDEDSVSFKNTYKYSLNDFTDKIKIALIDLPHISNATDLDPFHYEPDVLVTIARSPDDLSGADIIVIPGSKNVINDLNYLLSSGLSKGILRAVHSRRTALIGICGGFQMLGTSINDPFCIENHSPSEVKGLKLLDISTTLEIDKKLSLTQVIDEHSGCTIRGYEIHHGSTVNGCNSIPIMHDQFGKATGAIDKSHLVWGTYLHGVFDNDLFRRVVIDQARIRKGMQPLQSVQTHYNTEIAIDRLADEVTRSVDLEYIFNLLGISK